MRAWRERIRSTKERTLEDIEERASQLAEAAQRIRDRTCAGARVIDIAPIAEVGANNYDTQLRVLEANADTMNACKRAAETIPAEPAIERKEKIETEKTVKAKNEVDHEKERSKRKDRKIKSKKSMRKSRDSSSTEEMSEDDEPKLRKQSSSRKTTERSKKNI